MNLLECVENVCRVGVMGKVEFYVGGCPSVRSAWLNKLEEKMGDSTLKLVQTCIFLLMDCRLNILKTHSPFPPDQ